MKIKFLLFASVLLFASCNKKDDDSDDDLTTDDKNTVSMSNNNKADLYYTNSNDIVTKEIEIVEDKKDDENKGDGDKAPLIISETCAKITYKLSSDSSYVTDITIDYGEGCLVNGNTYSGKILSSKNGKLRDVGTVNTITFNNFKINGDLIEGTRVNTVTGIDLTAGTWTYTTEVKNAKITDVSGATSFTWESNRTTVVKLLTAEAALTGTAKGVNQIGIAFDVEITKELIVKAGCNNIVSGTLKISPQNFRVRTVDYGDGTCDDEIAVTIEGFDTFIVGE